MLFALTNMQNIEFKAELRDRELAEALLIRSGGMHVAELEQSDTYFRIADGRLRRRQNEGEPPEWVFYQREMTATPKLSTFNIYTEREAKERFGDRPIPVWVIVNKRREVWVYGPLRIHVDRVVGLGEFLEIEALVTRTRDKEACRQAVRKLRKLLSITLGEPIAGGYADLAARDAA